MNNIESTHARKEECVIVLIGSEISITIQNLPTVKPLNHLRGRELLL